MGLEPALASALALDLGKQVQGQAGSIFLPDLSDLLHSALRFSPVGVGLPAYETAWIWKRCAEKQHNPHHSFSPVLGEK